MQLQLPSNTALPGYTPPGFIQQQHQQQQQQPVVELTGVGQVSAWPLQAGQQQGSTPLQQQQAQQQQQSMGWGLAAGQSAETERFQERPASVPAGLVGRSRQGTNGV